MLIETLLFCSIITASPFYDCSNMWTLKIYDGDVGIYCYPNKLTLGVVGCALWTIGTTNYDGEILINQDVHGIRDRCGNTVLQHEIAHLVTRDRENCHEI